MANKYACIMHAHPIMYPIVANKINTVVLKEEYCHCFTATVT